MLIYITLIIIFVCIFIFTFFKIGFKFEKFSQQQQYNTIYTFWHDENLPEFLEFCIQTWRKHNPDCNIIVISMKNYKEYVRPGFDVAKLRFGLQTPTRTSDFIRMAVLEYNGGIWMDVSILCQGKLDILNHQDKFRGYYLGLDEKNRPNLENWCFACPPEHKFMKLWFNEALRMNAFDTIDEYVTDVLSIGVNLDAIPVVMRNYLACHVAAQKTIQTNPGILDLMVLWPATVDGPYSYLSDMDWDSEKAIESLCSQKYPSTIIKLRGSERNYIISNDYLFDCIKQKYS